MDEERFTHLLKNLGEMTDEQVTVLRDECEHEQDARAELGAPGSDPHGLSARLVI